MHSIRGPAAAVAAAAAIASFLILACSDSGESPPSPTAAPDASPAAAASATSSVPPTAVPTRPPGQTGVTGMFTDPRPATVSATRSLGARPASKFPPWDGVSTMLYDIVNGNAENLGPGTAARFSPDGSKLAWVAYVNGQPQTVWVRDLKTRQSREAGPGLTASWYDNDRIIYNPGSNRTRLYNYATGQTEPGPSANSPESFAQALPDGSRLTRTAMKSVMFPNSPYGAQVYAFALTGTDGAVKLEFEAFDARPAGAGELVVATVPLESGTLNIFIVNVNSGAAEFVATSRFQPPSMPLGAGADYVAWTEAYCGAGQGKTRLFDRRTRTITELDASLWVTVTPGGLIGEGEFGPSALFDPATMQYTVVIPSRAGQQGPALDVTWSPLFTYASQGQAGGHGGYCGG